VRVGGFATGIRVSLLPIVRELTVTHPSIEVAVSEYEPLEAFNLLVDDDLDLAITYDYNLAPASPDPVLETLPLWSTQWDLGVRTDSARSSAADLRAFADSIWIVDSRNTADEDAVRTLAALAGFTPRIAHQIRSTGRFVTALPSSDCRNPMSSSPHTPSSDAADPTGHPCERSSTDYAPTGHR
jgi:DNA-binding transcriptional LysR family regulator